VDNGFILVLAKETSRFAAKTESFGCFIEARKGGEAEGTEDVERCEVSFPGMS